MAPASPTPTATSTPSITTTDTVTPKPTSEPSVAKPESPYTVKPGDSLAGIASRFGVPEPDRGKWILLTLQTNSLTDADHVEVGQTLVLPSLDDLASATITATAAPEAVVATDTPTPEPTAVEQTSYVVQSGDTLSSIADSAGVSDGEMSAWLAQLRQLNAITDADHVEVGQTLILPSADALAAATPLQSSTTSDVLSASTTSDSSTGAAAPAIFGTSAAVLDADCGTVVYSLNAHERLAPASLAKIITAIVTLQHTSLDDEITADVSASDMAAKDYSVMGLEPGMQVSIKDLLYGLLLPSGNDAAETLASYVGGGSVSAFVTLMNQEAATLGLSDTHFTNPDGLDDPNLYSSAYDMAVAGMALLANPTLAQIVDTISYMPDSPDWTSTAIINDNQLLTNYPGAYGVKIGYDDNAMQTIVAAAAQNGRHVIVSVFGSTSRFTDAAALFDWAFANLPQSCGG
jgi:D-alanyl-D-alanine carboxypeptidase